MTPPKPTSRFSRLVAACARHSNAVLAATLLYLVAALTITLWQFWPPVRVTPVTSATLEILSPVIQPGARLLTRLTIDKARICAVDETHLLLSDEDSIAARLPPMGRLFPIGRTSRVLVHELPEHLAPGEYKYEMMLVYECRWPVGTYLIIPKGDHRFTVAAP